MLLQPNMKWPANQGIVLPAVLADVEVSPEYFSVRFTVSASVGAPVVRILFRIHGAAPSAAVLRRLPGFCVGPEGRGLFAVLIPGGFVSGIRIVHAAAVSAVSGFVTRRPGGRGSRSGSRGISASAILGRCSGPAALCRCSGSYPVRVLSG